MEALRLEAVGHPIIYQPITERSPDMSTMNDLALAKPDTIVLLDDAAQLMADYGFEDLAMVIELVLRDFDRRTR